CSDWVIPSVDFNCQGRAIAAKEASLKQDPNSNEFLSIKEAAGSFDFAFDAENIEFPITLTLSDYEPDFRDTIAATVSCKFIFKLTEPDTEINCTENDADFNITVRVHEKPIPRSEYNWDNTNKKWAVPINTYTYRSIVTAEVSYRNFMNFNRTNYTINLPPEIPPDNITEPPPEIPPGTVVITPDIPPVIVPVGGQLNLTVHLNDTNGISTVLVCDANGANANGCIKQPPLCTMNKISGSYYDGWWLCAITAGGIETNTEYCIFFNDSLGVWDALCSPYSITNDYFELSMAVLQKGIGLWASEIESGVPNLTKTMPLILKIGAYMNSNNSGSSFDCNENNCNVTYKRSDKTSYSNAYWDNFERAFILHESTSGLPCNDYSYVEIKVTDGRGLKGITRFDFYLNCNPRVTVDPIEYRATLGEMNKKMFNVTFWNPLSVSAGFEFRMSTTNSENYPLDWVRFNITGRDDNFTYLVRNESSASVGVMLEQAVRAGIYPIEFVLSTEDESYIAQAGNSEFRETGTLYIFAEALPEFAMWQVVVLLAAAFLIFLFFNSSQKKTISRKKFLLKNKK
ncbi:MAG TPA: hypothetical protein VJB11_04255, partial [archaeon]|nr:hypothetical protein [archaeon]